MVGQEPSRREHLDQVEQALTSAVSAQHYDADPAHEDFYAWGWFLASAMSQLSRASWTLQQQIAHYGDRRILRDDEGMDPAERLARMRVELAALTGLLDQAYTVADRYHQESSHLAVAVDPRL